MRAAPTLLSLFRPPLAPSPFPQVGGAPCTPQSVSPSQITCTLASSDAQAGARAVHVTVSPYGLAAGDASVAIQVLSIVSVSPSTLSTQGWTLVNISGAGIDTTNCTNNLVTIGEHAFLSSC